MFLTAWLTASQGFLAEGLQRTTAGLGSVIIDSQPLTVAVLAAVLYGEALTPTSVFGLILGIFGLGLLETPPQVLSGSPRLLLDMLQGTGGTERLGSIWDSGEWWMLLAAQSMAIGTVMVRWVLHSPAPNKPFNKCSPRSSRLAS